jgi:glyoxylase-like metal-dependent hydrolase (beta-lactamase superfamily II)
MGRWNYTKGLHQVGDGCFAYLSPDGSWGWSNAGLVVDGERSLLVDTLFDERLTAEMLAMMKDAAGVGRDDIAVLVNTHANGDHTYGNRLLAHAEIIASHASAEEMDEFSPGLMAQLMKAKPDNEGLEYLQELFGKFHFEGIDFVAPTRTFSGELDLRVGDKAVRLKEVGPAHTRGDVLVHVPDDRVVYTGDILFIQGTPVMWAGPVGNWIAACDYIESLDVEAIVPGHGPVTDKAGVRRMRDYLTFVRDEARLRYERGMPFEAAAADIELRSFADWGERERIVVNVHALYREFGATDLQAEPVELFAAMKRYRDRCRDGLCGHDHSHDRH